MSFLDTLERIKAYLERNQRLSLRAIQREYTLDQDSLNELVSELVEVQKIALRDGGVLVSSAITKSADSTNPTATAHTPDPAAKERRQLTILFCDLVGSTELSTHLDPEDLSETIRTYQDAVTRVVTRFDGHVAQHLGDGLLAYFGYPQMHEDSAEQAVRAALGIIDAINALDLELSVRIGLHTGLCVLRDVGIGEQRETLALGETPNIAARVQTAASTDSVLISAATHRLVSGWFIVEPAGTHQLKGLPEPIVLYRVLRASAVRNQLEARSQHGLTPLFGRTEELLTLWDRWTQARQGKGQMVLTTGEPGIGKSRLLRAFKKRLSDAPHLWLECAGSPYHRHTPFHAIAEMLQQGPEWQSAESTDDRIKTIEHSLKVAQLSLSEAFPLIASLLHLPLPKQYTAPDLLPDAQRKQTLSILVTWLLAATQVQPIVFVAEDLHWADPSSLELLELLAKQASTARILLLATARPEFRTPWPLLAHHIQIALPRLSATQTRKMTQYIAREKSLTPKIIDALIIRTEGVPLFIEELSTTALQAPDFRTTPLYTLPSTLHDSLIARLDRLGSAKKVAQIISVFGRQCSYRLLCQVVSLPKSELDTALLQLSETELLYQRGQSPDVHYIFKHTLIRDAAYESLLKRDRRQLHRQVFQVLTETLDETMVESEVTAYHAKAAGLVVESLTHYEQAATQARTRSAHIEAVAHLRQAIALLESLPKDEDHRVREATLQLALGGSLASTLGFGHPELEEAFARARVLCDQGKSDPRLASALLGLSMTHSARGEPEEGAALASRIFQFEAKAKTPALLIATHGRIALPQHFQGRFSSSLSHAQQALSIYHSSGISRQATLMLDQDWLVTAQVWIAWNQWHLGYPDQALAASKQAIDLAQKGEYPLAVGAALCWGAAVYGWRGDIPLLRERANELISLANRQSMPVYLGWGKVLLGWSLTRSDPEAAINTISESARPLAETGNLTGTEMQTRFLVEALRAAGQAANAIPLLDKALDFAERTGVHRGDAELHRLRAEIMLEIEPDSEAQAEAQLNLALKIAQAQQARSFVLRAATSLARLWLKQNKKQEAHALLAPAYQWFTEGFETCDLIQAKALLKKL